MALQYSNSNVTMTASEGARAFAALKKDVMEAKLLDRAYVFYTILITGTVIIWATLLYFIIQSTNLWLIGLLSVCFGFATMQLGGIFHDAGHRAIAKSSRANDIIGFVAGFLTGVLYSEWKPRHDKHHAHTNEEDEDPDLAVPLLSFSIEHARQKRGIERLLLPYQAPLYFPMGSLVWFSLRKNGYEHLMRQPQVDLRWIVDVVTHTISVGLWFVFPFLLFSLDKAILFFVIANWTMGLYALHVFAPNHKGMPELAPGTKMTFFEQQIVTSRNVASGPLTDFFYLGLNYQIEHHLFPSCPRLNQPALARIVQRHCGAHRLGYEICTPLEVDRIILRELAVISRTFMKNYA